MVDTASSGTYELLRARLQEQATELSRRAEALNELRLAEFGSSRFEVVASERIRTENNCIPRDIAPVGDHLLLGYNVFLGLKPQTTVSDVFSLHRFEQVDDTYALHPLAADADGSMLQDPAFVRDFDELYRYYKQTRLVQLQRAGNLLLAAFQIGDQVSDQRVLRWEVDRTGSVSYVDNRGERDLPHHPQFDFAWQPVGREHHRDGRVLLVDRVVVDPLGGTLEIRLEDNTPNGQVVLRETVQDPDQSLADCVMSFALLGDLLVLRVQPYAESTVRHFVVNLLTRQAQRIDALGLCCHQLPEDHGLIFPGGYYLRSGDTKTFDLDARDMALQTVVRSPNGEDVLFAFYEPVGGRSILLSYNMIRRELENPLHCHGWSLFDDGTLVVFREQAEPTRVHPVQMWRTPYESDEHASAQSLSDTPLGRIGNAELVRGVSEALAIRRLVAETTPSMEVYEDLATSVIRVLDAHWWLGEDAVGDLASPLTEIRDTAELVVDEFEKVVALQQAASERLAEAETDVGALLDELGAVPPSTTDDFVAALSSLRRRQGHLVGLGEVRYVDAERLGALTARVTEAFDGLSRRAVEFLAGADAFAGLHRRVEDLAAEVEGAGTTASLEEVGERVEAAAEDVDTLTTVVGGLEIEDPTLRTGILERIAEVLAGLNRVRALATTRRQELTGSEQAAAFAVEFQLFSQAASASLAQAATPQRCDAALGELMVALETLETRFRDSDDFADQLATKREDVYESFAAKRQQLVDERQRAAERLSDAAARILGSVQRRLDGFDSLDDVHAFFLSDPMVAKVRSVGEELRELGEPVRTDELATRLAALRDEAARSLRDRAELFEDDGSVVRLGRHRFSVEHRPLELTTVPSGDRLDLALTGTDFRLSLDEPALESTRAHWSQIIVSETEAVARAEYLAASLLLDAIDADADLTELREARTRPDGIAELVRRAAEARFDEGYDRGVHDHDAARLLEVLVDRYDAVGLLRHEPDARALAQLFWAHGLDDEARSDWQLRCRSLGQLRTRYRHSPVLAEVVSELAELIEGFAAGERLRHLDVAPHAAAAYLFEELTRDRLEFAASRGAVELGDAFRLHVDVGAQHLDDALAALDDRLADRLQLVTGWLSAFAEAELPAARPDVPEAAAMVLAPGLARAATSVDLACEVSGLLSQHRRISERTLAFRYDSLLGRIAAFRRETVPGFRRYQQARHEALERWRADLHLAEYQPQVMSAFVRNRLIDEVYLPLIGDNLAKQLGTVDGGRTDQTGLLLLVSPPGYGKTTLMEYVANRLGLVFVKVNGPALGTGVRSLDPAEAPNATAAQEVAKIGFALEMANNVLLYLDDIQHTHPELLQKFISLCDAQRRIEAVWRGRARGYDLRGKRFAVVMAGNPYTESGERFRVPDMLANRADTYNLGEVLSGHDDLFALSYLENSLTSNPMLAPLAGRDPADVQRFIAIARGEAMSTDELSYPYTAAEQRDIVETFRRLLRVQQVVLTVNRAYIASASQADEYRTEPPFRLQGSYRNMNRLAEKVVAVMSDAEIETLLDDHYRGEAQTLTNGAEANLLKLAELRGRLTPEQRQRWEQIRADHRRVQLMGAEDDPASRVAGAIAGLSDQLHHLGSRLIGDPPVG